jgi:Zn-dependent protease with chaperone function
VSATGAGLIAASILLDLPSALARLALAAVVAGLVGKLDSRADAVVILVGIGPYLRSVAALAAPIPAGPLIRAATGARRPSERERAALTDAFSLLPGVPMPRSVLIVDSPDENAWVIGSSLFLSRGLFESPHLVPVVAHEAGHLARGDGRVALAAWWLPVRSVAGIAARLIGIRPGGLPKAGPTLPQPGAAAGTGPGARRSGSFGEPAARRHGLGYLVRLPAMLLGACLLVVAGGAFPALLRPVWAAWRRSAEFAADAFAAAAGHGPALAQALGDWQVLDLATPWWQGRSHPYVEQRLDRLQQNPREGG